MTLLELIYRARLRLDDLGGDTGTPSAPYTYYFEEDDSGCLWGNQELISYVNSARNEFAHRLPLRDSTTEELTEITLMADVATYAIDPRILAIDSVVLASTGEPLFKLSDADDRSLWRDPYDTSYNEPTSVEQYRTDFNDYILTVYATPTEEDTLNLAVRRLPLDTLLWEDANLEIAEPAARYHEALLEWVCMQAYLKRDADTFNAELAGRHQGLFTDAVGPRIQFSHAAVRREVAGKRLRTRAYY
jgi:hypothetical protein